MDADKEVGPLLVGHLRAPGERHVSVSGSGQLDLHPGSSQMSSDPSGDRERVVLLEPSVTRVGCTLIGAAVAGIENHSFQPGRSTGDDHTMKGKEETKEHERMRKTAGQ